VTKNSIYGDRVGECDQLKQIGLVAERDERWQIFGNRSIEQHHSLIERYALHAGVPATVAQHYENARNAWLYSFFCYRLLQVAILQVHVAGEAAIKERAKLEGINPKRKLVDLLDIALEKRWLLDTNFGVTAESHEREVEHLEMLRFIGAPAEPFVGPIHEQDYAKELIGAFRKIRNALAHGEVILKPNLGWEFLAVRDLINQLFPCSEDVL
jgi:hypothetical protein